MLISIVNCLHTKLAGFMVTRSGTCFSIIRVKIRTCIDKELIGETGMIDVVYGAREYRCQNFEIAEHVLMQHTKRPLSSKTPLS